jgi:hypothetical protein
VAMVCDMAEAYVRPTRADALAVDSSEQASVVDGPPPPPLEEDLTLAGALLAVAFVVVFGDVGALADVDFDPLEHAVVDAAIRVRAKATIGVVLRMTSPRSHRQEAEVVTGHKQVGVMDA